MRTANIPRVVRVAFVVGLVLRLGTALFIGVDHPERAIERDSLTYASTAESLRENLRFNKTSTSSEPEFVRTPGYPVLLASLGSLFGDSVIPVLLLQALVSAGCILLVWDIARALGPPAAGPIAAWLLAVEPLQIWSSTMILTESMAAALLLIAVWLSVRIANAPRPWTEFAGLGVTMAVATLVRPATYYFLILMIPLVVAVLKRHDDRRALLMHVGAMVAPVLVLVGGWQIRNAIRVDDASFSGIESTNLYEYRAAAVVALRDGIPFDTARSNLKLEMRIQPGETRAELLDRQRTAALTILRENFQYLPRVWLGGAISLLFGFRSTVLQSLAVPESPWLVLALRLSAVATTAVALIGMALSLRSSWRPSWFALPLLGYLILVSAGPEAYGRMRTPFVPVLLIYAAVALDHLATRRGGGARK